MPELQGILQLCKRCAPRSLAAGRRLRGVPARPRSAAGPRGRCRRAASMLRLRQTTAGPLQAVSVAAAGKEPSGGRRAVPTAQQLVLWLRTDGPPGQPADLRHGPRASKGPSAALGGGLVVHKAADTQHVLSTGRLWAEEFARLGWFEFPWQLGGDKGFLALTGLNGTWRDVERQVQKARMQQKQSLNSLHEGDAVLVTVNALGWNATGGPLGDPNGTLVVGYVRSWSAEYGSARLTCRSGCSCSPTILAGRDAAVSTTEEWSHSVPYREGTSRCVLSIANIGPGAQREAAQSAAVPRVGTGLSLFALKFIFVRPAQ
eukprot:TRINITY_DN7115_c0_g1_i3.p1 TRINITY_DN7115_c0_g1~~TRINITY_DN7115_c0_g1_i3.p1  ORF type:complete len:317 (+),score=47.92 TRINITY_DN7115_c0_g1_i3:300-1250(+)